MRPASFTNEYLISRQPDVNIFLHEVVTEQAGKYLREGHHSFKIIGEKQRQVYSKKRGIKLASPCPLDAHGGPFFTLVLLVSPQYVLLAPRSMH